jgi:hypothetical protein
MFTTKERCDTMLNSLFPDQPHLQKSWWISSNKAFDNKTPEEMLEQDSLRVFTYLWSQLSGDYS